MDSFLNKCSITLEWKKKIPLIKITSGKYFDHTKLLWEQINKLQPYGVHIFVLWPYGRIRHWIEPVSVPVSYGEIKTLIRNQNFDCSQHCCLVDAHRLRKAVLMSGSSVDELIHLQSWQIAVNEFLGPGWGRKFICKEGLLDLAVTVGVPWCVSSPACYCAEGLFCCFGAAPAPCADLWWLL